VGEDFDFVGAVYEGGFDAAEENVKVEFVEAGVELRERKNWRAIGMVDKGTLTRVYIAS